MRSHPLSNRSTVTMIVYLSCNESIPFCRMFCPYFDSMSSRSVSRAGIYAGRLRRVSGHLAVARCQVIDITHNPPPPPQDIVDFQALRMGKGDAWIQRFRIQSLTAHLLGTLVKPLHLRVAAYRRPRTWQKLNQYLLKSTAQALGSRPC